MDIFDYFIYFTYLFARKIGNNEYGAKWSAFLFLSCWTVFFLIGILSSIGILWDNHYAQYLKTNKGLVLWFSLQIIVPCLFALKYYRSNGIQPLEDKYNQLSSNQKFWVKLLMVFILIAVPVFLFVSYRIYVFGYI